MFMADRLTLDAPKRTADGYLAVRARAARTGVYQYGGSDVDPTNAHGLRDTASVNVLRDEATVFDEASARSFIMKPVTDDHPSQPVTSANWKDHARGVVAGAMRDGDHLAFDLVLMDAAAIAAVDAGKRELSNGYDAALEFGDFTAADGTKCQARQTSIRGNHVALVDRGRAGPTCRIGDVALCDAAPKSFLDSLLNDGEPTVTTKTITFDGLPLLVTDAAEAAIGKLQSQIAALTTDKSGLETQVAALSTDGATKDAKIVTLEQAVKDAALTPQQLRDAAKAYALTAGKAKALGVTVTDAMDEGQIMAATVNAKMGDAAKNWTADQVAASFAVLTKDAKVADATNGVQPIGAPIVIGDAHTEYVTSQDKRRSEMRDAWKQPANTNSAAA